MERERVGERPLDGVRVLDLTVAAPGQMCTGLLGDMGADVICVQRPHGSPDDAMRSRSIRRNKRSLGLDLRSAQGKEVLGRLVTSADVLVEGMRPGAMSRLGFGYGDVAERNPRIVYCSISGYGQTGPYSGYPGYDLNFVGVAGYLDLLPTPDVPPFGLADFAAVPMHATIGILLALMARERIGVGQHVDISFADTTLALLAATSPYRDYADHGRRIEHMGGLFSGEYAFYATYEAADGRWLSVAASEPHFWETLCRALGVEHLIEAGVAQPDSNARRPTVEEAQIRQELEQVFRRKTRDEWLTELPRHDVCVAPVHTIEEALADAHFIERGMVRPSGEAADGCVEIGIPIKLSATPGRVDLGPPRRGEHTHEILESLGYSEAEIGALRSDGVTS